MTQVRRYKGSNYYLPHGKRETLSLLTVPKLQPPGKLRYNQRTNLNIKISLLHNLPCDENLRITACGRTPYSSIDWPGLKQNFYLHVVLLLFNINLIISNQFIYQFFLFFFSFQNVPFKVYIYTTRSTQFNHMQFQIILEQESCNSQIFIFQIYVTEVF